MADKSRKWLADSLRKHLVSAFEELGFEVVPLTAEEAASGELRRAFPFGRLRRASSRGLDLVEVQLDKYDPAFRLNIGVAPEGGIDHPISGHVDQQDIWVGYLDTYYEAYGWPLLQRWFRLSRWFGPPKTRVDYENLVADNLGLVREVEDVLREGKLDRHIRKVKAW